MNRTACTSPLVLILLSILASAFLAPDAAAQGVKSGEWFEDTTRIGFRMKSPKGWRFVPAKLGDPVEIGRFVPENYPWISLGGTRLEITNVLLEIDIGRLKREREERILETFGIDSLDDLPEEVDLEDVFPEVELESYLDRWVERNMAGSGFRRDDEDDEKYGKIKGREIDYVGEVSTPQGPKGIGVYMALIPVEEDRYFASVFNTSEDDYRKEKRGFSKLAKTFDRLELETFEYEIEGLRDFRTKKEKELAESIQNMPGWWMHKTEHYFVLSDSDDEQFIEEIGDRLEAIRKIYSVDYPAEKARRPRDEDEEGSVAGLDPLELSRLSVVRICSDRTLYHQYGGPPSSAGYWSSYHEELVFYDDKKGGGRDKTFAVLNHEAFHQYIYYFYGNLAPHSWYNEGTGDFYSGYQYNPKRKIFKLTPFSWRRQLAKDNARKGDYIPLEEIVRYSQREYYGNNAYNLGGGANYAQGWSFIWFLRHGAGKPKGWNDDWNDILETYLATLAETADHDEAVDEAFGGVDWQELEECWLNYIT